MIQENIVQILAIIITMIASVKPVLNQLKSALVMFKSKAESVDVQAIKDELDEVYDTLKKQKEINDLMMEFQLLYNNVLPKEYKDKIRELLDRK